MAFLRACLETRPTAVAAEVTRRIFCEGRAIFRLVTAAATTSKLVRRALSAMLVCCLTFPGLSARGQAAKEYDLKAAYLCKFALFVKWPTNAFLDAKTPITIGVLGSDPFGKSLAEAV